MMTDAFFICKSPYENMIELIRTEPGYIITSTSTRPTCAEKITEALFLDLEKLTISVIESYIGVVTDPWYHVWVDTTWSEITEEDYKRCKSDFEWRFSCY